MSDIVISEFMDQVAIDTVLNGRDVLYDPKFVDDSRIACTPRWPIAER